MQVNIIFHSIHGHGYDMAQAIKMGVESVANVACGIYRVPESNTEEILESMGAKENIKRFEHIPLADKKSLLEADGIVLGAPTYFGMPSGQMVQYLNQFGDEWVNGSLVGKLGSSFTTSSEQNGGAETCLKQLHTFFYHQGMLIVSLPSSLNYPEMHIADKVLGGYCYGASMVTGGLNDLNISEEEQKICVLQGRHMAQMVKSMKR